RLIAEQRLTMWYSAPSILSMLAQYGRLEEQDYSTLRMVLFAGEVFPVKHLRTLKSLIPGPRYFNLYGPTETNVCTFYEIPAEIAEARVIPFPIGKVCSHLDGIVVDESGGSVTVGEEGELCITGPGVMQGYWNLPERSTTAFLEADGRRWYRTGDIVIEEPSGDYLFVGRRDRMVKRRGHRIELGEVEAGLYRHPLIKEVAVVAAPDEHAGVRIKAFLTSRDGERMSVLDLKRFCAEVLPSAMVPDSFHQIEALPKTSTDKVDYQRLTETA
ncbi:MAG: AMP-binding protein, partial [Gemmatimonadota bacterium]|nr:AMP-binding protein [Gemmatimonadota bacterium]